MRQPVVTLQARIKHTQVNCRQIIFLVHRHTVTSSRSCMGLLSSWQTALPGFVPALVLIVYVFVFKYYGLRYPGVKSANVAKPKIKYTYSHPHSAVRHIRLHLPSKDQMPRSALPLISFLKHLISERSLIVPCCERLRVS